MLHAGHAQLPLAHQPPVDHPAQQSLVPIAAHDAAVLSSGVQGACSGWRPDSTPAVEVPFAAALTLSPSPPQTLPLLWPCALASQLRPPHPAPRTPPPPAGGQRQMTSLFCFGFLKPGTTVEKDEAAAARAAQEAADCASAAREKNEKFATASARAQAGLPVVPKQSQTTAARKKRKQREAAKKAKPPRKPDFDAADPDKKESKKVRALRLGTPYTTPHRPRRRAPPALPCRRPTSRRRPTTQTSGAANAGSRRFALSLRHLAPWAPATRGSSRPPRRSSSSSRPRRWRRCRWAASLTMLGSLASCSACTRRCSAEAPPACKTAASGGRSCGRS